MKQAPQHSKYDQENLRLKVQNWKKTHPDANFFHPRCIDSDCNSTAAEGKKVKLIALQLNSHRNTLFSGFTSKNGKKTSF